MDLEGSDGRERGEDGTKFEKQAALFAFAVSDIVLINVWSNSIGCVQAASIPLLRTVFEAMKKLKLRESETTLWFVLRDKSPKAPIEIAEGDLRKDIQRIWESVEKKTSTSETFKVKITGLSNYEYKKEEFVDEVANLKEQLLGELAENGRDERPASGFCFGVKQLWEMIKDNKDLDLPAHKIMVATVRCEDIAKNTFASLVKNKVWCQLKSNVQSVPVKDFGKGLRCILDEHLSGYDMETKYFDEDIRTQKRRQLMDKMLQHVEPDHQTMLERIHSQTLDEFKEAFPKEFRGEQLFRNDVRDYTKQFMTKFDKDCRDAATNQDNWGAGAFKLRSRLQCDIEANVFKVHSDAMSEYLKRDKKKLEELLSVRVENLLDTAADGTWQEIREFLCETHTSFKESSTDIDKDIKEKNLKELNEYARHIIHEKSRQEAKIVQTQMVDRFEKCFTHDFSNILRVWTGKEDIKEMDKNGRIAALKRLSIMAAIRLDDDVDDIEKTLFSAFIDLDVSANDSLDSDTWAKVSPGKTLIKPVKCKNIWVEFNKSSELIVNNARVIRKGVADGTLAKTVALTAGGIVLGATAVAGVITAVTVASPVTGIAAGVTGVAACVVGLASAATEAIKLCKKDSKKKN